MLSCSFIWVFLLFFFFKFKTLHSQFLFQPNGGGFPSHLFTTGSVWFCDYWRAVRTHGYMRAFSHNSEADAPTCRLNGRPHDTLGKGELAVTTEKEQISGVNINVQLGLCTQPLFFSPYLSP